MTTQPQQLSSTNRISWQCKVAVAAVVAVLLPLSLIALIANKAWLAIPGSVLWFTCVTPIVGAVGWPEDFLGAAFRWQQTLRVLILGSGSPNRFWRRLAWYAVRGLLSTCWLAIASTVYLLPALIGGIIYDWVAGVWIIHLCLVVAVVRSSLWPQLGRSVSLRLKRGPSWRAVELQAVEEMCRRLKCPTCGEIFGPEVTVTHYGPPRQSAQQLEGAWQRKANVICGNCGCLNSLDANGAPLIPAGHLLECQVERRLGLKRLQIVCYDEGSCDETKFEQLMEKMPELEELWICDFMFENRLPPLTDLTTDRNIFLLDPIRIDAALGQLKSLPGLRRLDVAHMEVTDTALKQLESLTQLRELQLYAKNTNDVAIEALKHSLPECAVSTWTR